jgi:hypothetical protein
VCELAAIGRCAPAPCTVRSVNASGTTEEREVIVIVGRIFFPLLFKIISPDLEAFESLISDTFFLFDRSSSPAAPIDVKTLHLSS